MQRLHDRFALVTGAGRGIGRAIALAFAREGAHVAVHYQMSRAGAEDVVGRALQMGVRAFSVQADVSNRAQVEAMFRRVREEFGRLDVLVNNAAIFSAKPLFQVTEELWDRVQAVNLKGTFLCCQEGARLMLEHGGGVIVNLGSGGGLDPRPGYETSVAYAAAKAGVIMLTRRLALELAPHIRVNCIAPGVIESKAGPMPRELRERFARQVPLGRVGDVEDIADAAVFLASAESDFITGQVISVDGGVTMH